MGLFKELLKSLSSSEFKKFRDALRNINHTACLVKSRSYEYDDDRNFWDNLTFFSHLFFTHGFLVSRKPQPAFNDAYLNFSNDILRKTYVALPAYFSFRYGLVNLNLRSTDELRTALSKLYPTLDLDTLESLLSEWSKANPDQLDDLLYEHFEKFKVFENVYVEGADVRRWFKSFLNQALNYTFQRPSQRTESMHSDDEQEFVDMQRNDQEAIIQKLRRDIVGYGLRLGGRICKELEEKVSDDIMDDGLSGMVILSESFCLSYHIADRWLFWVLGSETRDKLWDSIEVEVVFDFLKGVFLVIGQNPLGLSVLPLDLAFDIEKNTRQELAFYLGAEYWLARFVGLRGGLDNGKVAAGASFRLSTPGPEAQFDYGLSTDPVSTRGVHRICVLIGF